MIETLSKLQRHINQQMVIFELIGKKANFDKTYTYIVHVPPVLYRFPIRSFSLLDQFASLSLLG